MRINYGRSYYSYSLMKDYLKVFPNSTNIPYTKTLSIHLNIQPLEIN